MQLISQNNSIEDFVKFVKGFIETDKRNYTIPYENIPDFIPQPLRIIHHEFGNFPLNHLFGHHDRLVDVNNLKVSNKEIVFAEENQGCWEAKTNAYETNPLVYLVSGDYEMGTFGHLSDFLVTFCLVELMYSSYNYPINYDYNRDNHFIDQLVCMANNEPIPDYCPIEDDYSIKYQCDKDDLKKTLDNSKPIWLNGKSVHKTLYSFYLTEDNLMLLLIKEEATLVASKKSHNTILNSNSVSHLLSPIYKEKK